jgi:ribosomal protein S18 acetylase RimI-like enzyme
MSHRVPGKSDPRKQIATRRATSSDLDFVLILGKSAFEPYGAYEGTLRAWFQSGLSMTLIATLRERPVGFAMLGPLETAAYLPNLFELLAIAVMPSEREKGIGNLLLTEAEERARRQGGEILVLHTALENAPAQGLFKKQGFTPSDMKKGFYPEGQDALLMYKNISSP